MPRARHTHRNPATAALVPNATENVIQIIRPKRVFQLRQPIDLTVREQRGLVLIEYEPLGIIAWGDDELDALSAFADEFEMIWDVYGTSDDSELGPSARRLKKKINAMVARVEPAS